MSSKTAATLTVVPSPLMGPDARLVELDCPCGTTRVAYVPGPIEFGERELAMVALGKHRDEQPGCTCIARLWRETFEAPLGQVILVKGAGGSQGATGGDRSA